MAGGLLAAILAYSIFLVVSSIQFTRVFNNTKGSVLLAAVLHGASNAWGGYIDVYRGNFGGIPTFTAVSILVSMVIVLMAGASNLSRKNKRNVVEDRQLNKAESPKGEVAELMASEQSPRG